MLTMTTIKMKTSQMQKRTFTHTTVINSQSISPSIKRLTLHAESPFHFGKEAEGGYVKLLFTPQGSTDIDALAPDQRPIMRTYTLREIDTAQQTVVIDFVRHAHTDMDAHNATSTVQPSHGLAAAWAETAKKGDSITFGGPGILDYPRAINYDWIFFVADMTSLPALSVLLSDLPADTQGYAVIEINTADDQQSLQAPTDVDIIWVIADQDASLTEKVMQQPWLAGTTNVWCACEFDSMRTLRRYFTDERAINKEDIYLSSYWKKGVTEDGHKTLKRQDAESIA
jgi:NADPH-dependent ferric siderophore reductase